VDTIVSIPPKSYRGYDVAHIFKDIHTEKDHAYLSYTATDFLDYLRFVVRWTKTTDGRNGFGAPTSQMKFKHIRIQNSAPYSHWQQSVKRAIQTIVRGTSSLLYYEESLNATYLDLAMVHFVDDEKHS
jgi:hypothetical protein